MDSRDYYANYFRPEKQLGLWAVVRIEPVEAAMGEHKILAARLTLVDSSPCRKEMHTELRDIRERGDTDAWLLLSWGPQVGVRLDGSLNYDGGWPTMCYYVQSDEFRMLAERMAVLAVLSNLGYDAREEDSVLDARNVKAYLSYR